MQKNEGGGRRAAGRPRLPLIQRKPFATFRDHKGACPKCANVDLDKPATLALACLIGSRLVKDAANFARTSRGRAAAGVGNE